MKTTEGVRRPILLKLRCGHIIDIREYRKKPWCPFCGLEILTDSAKEFLERQVKNE